MRGADLPHPSLLSFNWALAVFGTSPAHTLAGQAIISYHRGDGPSGCNRGRQFIVPPWDRGCYCTSDLTVPAPPHPSPITHPPKITKHTLTLWADRLWQLTDPVCAACVCVCESLCVCVCGEFSQGVREQQRYPTEHSQIRMLLYQTTHFRLFGLIVLIIRCVYPCVCVCYCVFMCVYLLCSFLQQLKRRVGQQSQCIIGKNIASRIFSLDSGRDL